MKNYNISLVQPDTIWKDPHANMAGIEEILEGIDKTDLIVLPEMFSTGFVTHEALAQNHQDSTMEWMQNLAKRFDAVITGSLAYSEGQHWYNRLWWVSPDETRLAYDKHYLFALGEETKIYSRGTKRIIANIDQLSVCPLICYDLRFPEWSRNNEGFDLLVYVANWPSQRQYAWEQLLVARAIENQCYVAGVNRVGTDGQGIRYTGSTRLISPSGKIIADAKDRQNVVVQGNIDLEMLRRFRQRYPFLEDQNPFTLHP